MALRKVSAATEAELRAILEFDLDAFLEDHPEALRQIEAGVRAVEVGDIVDHEEV